MPLITSKRGGPAPGTSTFVSTMNSLNPDVWWRLGEFSGPTAFDEQGAANGTYVAPPYQFGNPGLIANDPNTCVLFNGVSQYVNGGSPAILTDIFDSAGGGGSLVVWVSPNAIQADATLFAKNDNINTGYLWRFTDPDATNYRLRFFQFENGNNGGWNSTNRDVSIFATSMIGLTFDDNVANDPVMYVNGVSVAVTETDTPSGGPNSDAGIDFQMGANAAVALPIFALLDEGAIWKGTQLTAQNMLDLYNSSI